MIPTLTELNSEIGNGELPLADMFSSVDCDSLLDKRDSDSVFDAAYREHWEKLESLKKLMEFDPAESICEQAFLAVSNATQHHKIASYVSDDFALIGFVSYSKDADDDAPVDSPLVEWLYLQYKSGSFPCPPYRDGDNGG